MTKTGLVFIAPIPIFFARVVSIRLRNDKNAKILSTILRKKEKKQTKKKFFVTVLSPPGKCIPSKLMRAFKKLKKKHLEGKTSNNRNVLCISSLSLSSLVFRECVHLTISPPLYFSLSLSLTPPSNS
jgi:hypothetical protein